MSATSDASEKNARTKAAITAIVNQKIEGLWQNFPIDQLHREIHQFFHAPKRSTNRLLPHLNPLVIYLPAHKMSDDGGDDQ